MKRRTALHTTIEDDLYLIALDQDLPGFVNFISAWVRGGDSPFLVDPGPAATIDELAEALGELGIRRLGAILLTHIHIDHAGGAGDLLRHFPDTPVICHPAAAAHLKDPARLWEGSLKTLGKTAEAYGPIAPVPADLIRTAEAPLTLEDGTTIEPILTPGHAPHHVSFRVGDILMGGEAGGVFMDLGEDRFYLRPATPPRFFLETSLASLEALIDTPHRLYCYGHCGATRRTPELLKRHREQLFRWEAIIEAQMAAAARKCLSGPDRIASCIDALIEQDPLMAAWDAIPADIRARERGFLKNSVAGFIGYLESRVSA